MHNVKKSMTPSTLKNVLADKAQSLPRLLKPVSGDTAGTTFVAEQKGSLFIW